MKRFISEPIVPETGSFDTAAMAQGEPGLPTRFTWRGKAYEVAQVLETWKSTTDCRDGSKEQYLRKHWYRIRTVQGLEMEIYFDRQPQSKRDARQRWWVLSVTKEE